jgi:hypothetical protein
LTNYLAKKAILVSLNISHWKARKHDKRVTDKVNAEHHAKADAGRYNKLILPKDAIDPVEKIVGRARAYHIAHTLPWCGDARLLSVREYEEYAKAMLEFESEFNAAKRTFLKNYESFVAQRRIDLNGMFNEKDYPSNVEGKFSFGITPMPFADASDLRIELADAHAEGIRAEIEKAVNAAHRDAMNEPLRRVLEAVGHMAERLTVYKPGDKGVRASGTFKDSLVENVLEIADLLPTLNIAENPELDRLAADLKAKLCVEDAKTLRDNDDVRAAVKADAAAILARVESLLA